MTPLRETEEPTSRRGSVEMRAKPISSADISAAASALARKASAHGGNGANPVRACVCV